MKIFFKFLTCLLLTGMLFVSCDEQNIDQIVTEDPDFQPDEVVANNLLNAMLFNNTSSAMDLGCVAISFPFDMTTASGATVTVNSEEDFLTAISDTADPVVDFVYPVTGTDADGVSTQYSNSTDLGVAFGSCIPDSGWDDAEVGGSNILPAFLFNELCLDLVYPVNLEDLAGGTYVANDDAELINLLATVDALFFSLPLSVVDEGGNVVTITDEEGFYTLAYNCSDVTPPSGEDLSVTGFGCFSFVYPYSVLDAQGNVITINDDNEYANLILSGDVIILQYPLSLEDEDGNVTVVNDDQDLIDALNTCGGFFIYYGPIDELCDAPAHELLMEAQGGLCGDVVYPFQLTAGGTTIDVNDINDYNAAVASYPTDVIELVYPIELTYEGDTGTLNNDIEVCILVQACTE